MPTLTDYMRAKRRVMLVGPPGIGKTARIAQAANDCGRELVVLRASLCDRLDVAGAVIPDFAAGITRVLPLETLFNLKATKKPTLFLMDDLGQGPMEVQAALMSLFDNGALSDQVLIWGATNRVQDKAGVSTFCEPLRSRFNLKFALPVPGMSESPDGAVYLGNWADEVAQWCAQESDNNGPAEVIAWHRATSGRTLYAWKPCADPSLAMPDYRAWSEVSILWNAGLRDLQTIGACIGRPAAAEFLAFARLAQQLPSPDQVWIDPDNAPVPTEASALYLISSMLAASAQVKHARALVRYLSRLPRVYGALLARDALRRLGVSLTGSKEWVAWFNANQSLFTAE